MKYGCINQKCPKCGGNIFRDSDRFGWYEHCLQCGFIYSEEIPPKAVVAATVDRVMPTIRQPVAV